jgi:hypothetical protein
MMGRGQRATITMLGWVSLPFPGHMDPDGRLTHRVSEGRLIITSHLRFRAAAGKSVAVRDRKESMCIASRIYIQECSKHFEETLRKIRYNEITKSLAHFSCLSRRKLAADRFLFYAPNPCNRLPVQPFQFTSHRTSSCSDVGHVARWPVSNRPINRPPRLGPRRFPLLRRFGWSLRRGRPAAALIRFASFRVGPIPHRPSRPVGSAFLARVGAVSCRFPHPGGTRFRSVRVGPPVSPRYLFRPVRSLCSLAPCRRWPPIAPPSSHLPVTRGLGSH